MMQKKSRFSEIFFYIHRVRILQWCKIFPEVIV